ncbi:RHD3/Sey1 [Mucor mucedo]|uniref:RHD3/Sey1 n=1 Tax=Mucor mucedo TaxID=29922 RepID=UPI00221F4A2A|nr:RHD3/Sey1 [Mucor mucedo]KAI7876131.1 RHD3/Sey1 [Mucor mucedo]
MEKMNTENRQEKLDSTTTKAATSSIPDWDHDVQVIPRLQVVDEHQKFTNDLPEYMKKWGLAEAGFKYDVVAVFGSQSTGKSTLLNRLFGTSFAEMDENQRKQTTKGIWLSRGRGMHVLVMDVEGTDGRERGEDQDFERKSALFSMATSEVIIINLWEHQVGLYQGANMGLLKTVFEVNLQLFQNQKSKEKTLLLIVIRDFVGSTPLENLAKTLKADLEKIWASLAKPEGLEDCKITDYFDFMFTGLPHKILLPDKFDEEVAKLRLRFNDPQDPNFVFRPEYHKRIPADGYHMYASSIWDKVLTNKDLDLPTQQELLAQYRCDEISNAAFEVFKERIAPYKSTILEKHQIIPELGEKMKEIRQEAVQSFDKSASRYNQTVYQKKRIDMLAKLNTQLGVYFVGQLNNLHKKAVILFEETLQKGLRTPGYNFANVVSACLDEANTFFLNGAKAVLLPETDWSYAHEQELLAQDFDEISSKARTTEFKKMNKALEKQIELELADPVALELNRPEEHMWHKIIDIYNNTVADGEKLLAKNAKSFDSSKQEIEKSVTDLKRQTWIVLRKKVDEELADNLLLLKLRNKFEEEFRYDETGIPRVWSPQDDIDSHFKKARDETLALIKIFSKVNLSQDPEFNVESNDDFDFQRSLVILSEAKQIDITNRFKRESDAFYLEAKRSIVSTTDKIPPWVIVMMIVLGWNEFMAILRSPTYIILAILCGSILYIIYSLNLWGPAERIVSTVTNEATRMIKDKLMEAASTTDQGRQQYEMRNIREHHD